MQRLHQALTEGSYILDLEARDLDTIFHQTLNLVISRGLLSADQRDDVARALRQREDQASTAIGHAVAVPHAYLDVFSESVIVFVRLAHPLNLGAPDGIPTRYLFVLLGPPGTAAEHLDALTVIARLMSDDEFRYEARGARNVQELLSALDRFRHRTLPAAAVAPQDAVSEGLVYTGRPFGGLVRDVRRRLPHYLSDFREGLHPKCVASTLFLYFACLAPAVTFGGLMGAQTNGHIGAVEMLAASAVCGVLYALFAGHPLIILGGTGPMLIFTVLLYQLCTHELEIPFLPAYAWVGLWTAGFMLLLAMADASSLMRFFTRFTDEIFAALISIIFIYEAIKSLVEVFQDLDVGQHHDTALLSLVLALGTFYIAMSLSRFRRSRYLLPQLREFLADFGPTIAVVSMALFALTPLLRDVDLSGLDAPSTLSPTMAGRAWTINLFHGDLPRWWYFAAAGPALLGAVLVFLDTNITSRLVNSPDHRLQKGEAYHWDLGLVGGLIAFCSLFGFPWLVAATVRSLNHVRSLASFEEVVTTGGSTREQIIHVRENRLTGLAIHLMIGLSLWLLLPYLKMIPMAVLYGLFLFMGVVSMAGNQFFERLSLWLTDPNLYPATHYIRRVPMSAIHKFTILQLVCLIVLWIVKESPLGIVFPLFIALLVPVRMLAGRYFAPESLAALDAEHEPDAEETHWV